MDKSLYSYSLSSKDRAEVATAQITQAIRITMIGNALGATTFVNSSQDIDSDDETIISSDEQIIELRNNTLQMLEDEMIRQGDDEQELYETLSNAYAATYFNLNQKLTGEGKTKSITITERKPLLVTAYEQNGSISKVEEIARRNSIHNALFPPVGKIIVSE